jgi:hypothetical protein
MKKIMSFCGIIFLLFLCNIAQARLQVNVEFCVANSEYPVQAKDLPNSVKILWAGGSQDLSYPVPATTPLGSVLQAINRPFTTRSISSELVCSPAQRIQMATNCSRCTTWSTVSFKAADSRPYKEDKLRTLYLRCALDNINSCDSPTNAGDVGIPPLTPSLGSYKICQSRNQQDCIQSTVGQTPTMRLGQDSTVYLFIN